MRLFSMSACFAATAFLAAAPFAYTQNNSSSVAEQPRIDNIDPVDSLQKNLYNVFQNNKKAIVKVYAQKEIETIDNNGNPVRKDTLDVGTGFVSDKNGIIVTSAYISCTAKKIWIERDGVLFDAHSIGIDPLTTIAVLKPDKSFETAEGQFVKFSTDTPIAPVSTLAISISHEMGLPPAPRFGLTTGHNIEFGGNFLPTIYVRTNIPVARGGIGGSVFDIKGNFIGMTIAGLSEIGGSFILPAKAVAKLRDDIVLCGEPVYSWFGLRAEDTDSNVDNSSKISVTMVAENSPAKKAGFLVGDKIVEINSRKVFDNTELRSYTFFVRPGESAEFKILRNNKTFKLEVVAERMPSEILKTAEIKLAVNLSNKSAQNNKSKSALASAPKDVK